MLDIPGLPESSSGELGSGADEELIDDLELESFERNSYLERFLTKQLRKAVSFITKSPGKAVPTAQFQLSQVTIFLVPMSANLHTVLAYARLGYDGRFSRTAVHTNVASVLSINVKLRMVVKAVIFDIGGVVMRSPMLAIAQYEEENNLPPNYINCIMYDIRKLASERDLSYWHVFRANIGPNGAFQRLERGEISLFPFYKTFSLELSASQGKIWYEQYCKNRGLSE